MKYTLLPVTNSSFAYICEICKEDTQGFIVMDDETEHFMPAVGTNKRFPAILGTVCSEECFNLWLMKK